MKAIKFILWLILCIVLTIAANDLNTPNEQLNNPDMSTVSQNVDALDTTNGHDYDGTTENSDDDVNVDDNGSGKTDEVTENVTSLSPAYADLNETQTEFPTTKSRYSSGSTCKDGLILPMWRPQENITSGDRFARGLVYFLAMSYLFLGVSIVSDKFMAAIEKITAIEKEVSVRKADGTQQKIVVRVWNETVANLTLMALGTSAPEILLSIIEIFTNNFEAGELGPGTIVGSAAFNLFCIISLCIVVIPKNEVRRIKHLRVFFVTATWSIFAYIWLYLILAFFSPGVIAIWEGFITFLCFPLIVYMAYVADRRMLVYKYLSKGYRMNERGVMVQMETIDPSAPMQPQKEHRSDSVIMDNGIELMSDEFKDLEKLRLEYIKILQDLKQKYPQYSARSTLEMMAQEKLLNSTPKSHAFYRVQAGRKILGGGNIVRKIAEKTTNEVKADLNEVNVIDEDDLTPTVCFQPNHYTCMENCGSIDIRVVRLGDFSGHVSVDYQTQDGSAEAATDYIAQSGTITFTPGISERFINIEIIDDDIFEEDESFFIQLSNPTNGAILGQKSLATVMILDDDHAGFFSFAEQEHELIETVGVYELKVVRASGARGCVALPYWTEDGSAKGGKDYESQASRIIFNNNETE
ncbi:sodium/calcium exchanger 3-like [Contarinia nasturtii]|uniref:sodium/calcium exchanger 3-like n=1 Tax=Contarinia nasturtii TaxID=265458 RepID=UPI0012D4AEF6|nr:sodium/calcium exchanger 3-like [Contarinia nasturtii]